MNEEAKSDGVAGSGPQKRDDTEKLEIKNKGFQKLNQRRIKDSVTWEKIKETNI